LPDAGGSENTYGVEATSAFSRSLKKLVQKQPAVLGMYETMLRALRQDPANQSLRFDIKKLSGVAPGDGQWRIRGGNFRMRYDIDRRTVILHSINDRRDAYR